MLTKERVYDLILSAFLIIVSIVCYYLVPYQVPQRRNYGSIPFTPDLFPRIVMVITVILAVFLVSSTLSQYLKTKSTESAAGAEEELESDIRLDKLLLVILILFAYVFCIDAIGYLITTLMFLAVLMYVLENRNYIALISTSIITTALTFYVFRYLMMVPLPPGIWTI